MDNIWIFLVIIGAVFSFAQKNQSKRQGSDAPTEDNNGEEPVNPHEMMERRLRELLGEQQPKRVPTPTVAPTAAPAPTTTVRQAKNKPTYGTLDSRPMSATAQHKNATQSPSAAQYKSQIAKATSNSIARPSVKPAHTNANTNNEQIGQIINDFSMEKAVIYSEILKPKFEEY